MDDINSYCFHDFFNYCCGHPRGTQGVSGDQLSYTHYGMFGGIIDSVDIARKDFSVKNGMEEMTFYLSDDAKITEGKKTLSFGDLKKGQEVTIEYTKEGNELIADMISINTPKTGG